VYALRESQDLGYLGHLGCQDSPVSKERLVQKVIVASQDLQVLQDALAWMGYLDQKVWRLLVILNLLSGFIEIETFGKV
jgi:hypothetical protein